MKFEFDFDHSSHPAVGVSKKNDFRYEVKLDYEFEGDESDWFR